MTASELRNTERFAALFRGYDKAYGEFIAGKPGNGGKIQGKATTISEPVTIQHFERHLTGITGLGIIPLDADERVSWGCIDIDVIDIDHRELVKKVTDSGFPLVVARSKSGGAHCFLFLDQPSDAVKVRDYLRNCASVLGHEGCEIFPKQVARKEGETGNWLNMPYYNADETTRYAFNQYGKALNLEEFLTEAEARKTSVSNLPQVATNQTTVVNRSPKRFVLPDIIPEGERDTTLFQFGCSLRAKGGEEEGITAEIRRANAELCNPPLLQGQVNKIIKQVLKYEQGSIIPEWVEDLNQRHAVVAEAGKATVLNTNDYDPAMRRRFVTRSTFGDFAHLYCNQFVAGIDREGSPVRRPLGKAWLEHPQRRQYNGVVFAPNEDVPGYYNMWRGYSVTPRSGDWSLFRAHLFENVCSREKTHYDYLIRWIAFLVQQPGQVPGVSVVLRGGRGTGKGFTADAIGSLVSEHYCAVSNPEHVTGRFNAHIENTILLFLDEAFWAGNAKGESTLKQLITEKFIPIEAKYRNAVMARNCCHVMMAANADWVVPAGLDERRFFVLEVSDAQQQKHDYFAAIDRQLNDGGREAMLHDLLAMDLTGFNHRQAPHTEALREQKLFSMNHKEAWWYECLWNGYINVPNQDTEPYWSSLVAKEGVYASYLHHAGEASTHVHRGTQTAVGRFLKSYLPDGWPKEKKVPKEVWHKGDDDSNGYKSTIMVPGWELPKLAICRDAFDRKMVVGEDWPAEEAWQKPLTDEEIPF